MNLNINQAELWVVQRRKICGKSSSTDDACSEVRQGSGFKEAILSYCYEKVQGSNILNSLYIEFVHFLRVQRIE